MCRSFTLICFVLFATFSVLVMAAPSKIEDQQADGNAVVLEPRAKSGSKPTSSGNNNSSPKVIKGKGSNSGKTQGKCKSKTSCPARGTQINMQFLWKLGVRALAVHKMQLIANHGESNEVVLYNQNVSNNTHDWQWMDGTSQEVKMNFDLGENVKLFVDGQDVIGDFCDYDCNTNTKCTCTVEVEYQEDVQSSGAKASLAPGSIAFNAVLATAGYVFVDWILN
ncbi:hypothetical protein Ddc_16409 [Ditylenchus destructor]|nr:hypothetical protein Ddc_16409 [Ditylenchus destructor]